MVGVPAAVVVLAFLKMTSLSCKEKNNFNYIRFQRSQNSETWIKIYF